MKRLIGLIVITIVFFAVTMLMVHTVDHGRCADAHPTHKAK